MSAPEVPKQPLPLVIASLCPNIGFGQGIACARGDQALGFWAHGFLWASRFLFELEQTEAAGETVLLTMANATPISASDAARVAFRSSAGEEVVVVCWNPSADGSQAFLSHGSTF